MLILRIVLTVVFLLSMVLMIKNRKSVPSGQIVEDPLTGKEKLYIWLFCILNPILAGAIFYYGWKKKLPKKARQANQISLWAFFIIILISIGFFVLNGLNEERVKSEHQQQVDSLGLLNPDEFEKGFEGKTYRESMNYCQSFDSNNKDSCLLALATQAFFSEGDVAGFEKEICPLMSEKTQILCYVVLEKCDSLESETKKTACESEVQKKKDYIKANTSN